MKKTTLTLPVSKAREKLTKLDKILKPGEILQITKRRKNYAKVELTGGKNRIDEVLKSIKDLPEPKEKLRNVAENYKKYQFSRGTK